MIINNQIRYLKKLNETKEWVNVLTLVKDFEFTLEELFNEFSQKLPVYMPDLITRIYHISEKEIINIRENNVSVNGIIPYNRNLEQLTLSHVELPYFLDFNLNEITGEWRLELDCEKYTGFISDEEIKKTYQVGIFRHHNYIKYAREKDAVALNITIELSKKFVYEVPVIEEQLDRKIGGKFEKVALPIIKVYYNNMQFIAVPDDIFNNAFQFISKKIPYESDYTKYYYAYEYAANLLYLNTHYIDAEGDTSIYDRFDIDFYARINYISYFEARNIILSMSDNYYLKIVDILELLEHRITDDRTSIDKWNYFKSEDKNFEMYRKYAIAKFENKDLTYIFDEVLQNSKKNVSESSQKSATSKFGNKVKEFAEQNNLPIWKESRGRPSTVSYKRGLPQ